MKKINLYRVGILKSGEKYFEKSEVDVIAENDTWIVLDTENYDKVTKSKSFEFAHDYLDNPRLFARDEGDAYFSTHKYWGNGVFYILYTYKNKRPQTIKKEIQNFLDDKFGYLAKIDLSFIVE